MTRRSRVPRIGQLLGEKHESQENEEEHEGPKKGKEARSGEAVEWTHRGWRLLGHGLTLSSASA